MDVNCFHHVIQYGGCQFVHVEILMHLADEPFNVSRNARQAALRLANATTSGRKNPTKATQTLTWDVPKITTIL
jgi:hypothetical protein